MTLLQVRKLFVTLSGRYDLVIDTDDYADDGADFFLQAGQRLLDSKFTHSKSKGIITVDLETGTKEYSVPNMLSIDSVKVATDEGRVTLNHLEEDVLESYFNEDDTPVGCPKYYGVYSGITNPLADIDAEAYSKLVLKVYPVPETAMTAYVRGRISVPLAKDDDINFWTVNYPETLMSAAMYEIERFHRNRQGMADHMEAINIDLRELDANEIENQMGSKNQMNDSFEFRGEGNVR